MKFITFSKKFGMVNIDRFSHPEYLPGWISHHSTTTCDINGSNLKNRWKAYTVTRTWSLIDFSGTSFYFQKFFKRNNLFLGKQSKYNGWRWRSTGIFSFFKMANCKENKSIVELKLTCEQNSHWFYHFSKKYIKAEE